MPEDKSLSTDTIDQIYYLSDGEKAALKYFYQWRGKDRNPSHFPIAVDKQIQLYNLYLNGATCTEIRKINSNFGLGQIVAACVEGDWQNHRIEYIKDLFTRTRQKAAVAVEESIGFVINIMTATHKLHNERLQKFIQTGEIGDLDKSVLSANSLKSYHKAINLLMKLTGQDKIQKIELNIPDSNTSQDSKSKVIDATFTDIKSLAAMKKASR